MAESLLKYNHRQIEKKWQKIWAKNKTFQVNLKKAKKPYYNLMMFPYPSAQGLHVGNMYAFTGSDIWGRFMSMKGYDVFEPIGLDGFGIHSENYAIKVGRHPVEQAKISAKNFYRQLKLIGNQFSWDNCLETYDPDYYKWTQWIFIKMFKAGLAYQAKAPVNWCPSCKTVLADEQVIKRLKIKEQRAKIKEEISVCERCSTEVITKNLKQWFFRITKYADCLLDNLAKIDWTEKVKIAQKNWIGRKRGINIYYDIVDEKGKNLNLKISCFTTRPDTNFGATFVVLAPESPIVALLLNFQFPIFNFQKEKIKKYIEKVKSISREQRISQKREKTGVFTGLYALNKLTGYKMPVWVSDFVLMDYGTGAVVGVPGHDKRDFEFAKKFGLKIKRVVIGKNNDQSAIVKLDQVEEGEGTAINSGFLNGLKTAQAKEKIIAFLEKKGWGKRAVNYHLRDWLISRQRYWGPPIPMVYCESCAKKGDSWFTSKKAKKQAKIGNWKLEIKNSQQAMKGWYPVPEKSLPVKLPYVKDWRPKGTGRGPLAQLKGWVKIKCPQCGAPAQRETDVSDTFLDSAWYFLRYPSLNPGVDTDKPWNFFLTKKWLPVDMYIGGAEHAVLHLLYSRFITMVFKDLGWLDFSAKAGLANEPFKKFRAHGLIIKDGAKMSKSKGNVVNPDEYIKKYGADTLRCYLMFIGPLSAGGDFRDTGMKGMYRFLTRVYRLVAKSVSDKKTPGVKEKEEVFWQHKTIKRVEDGIKRLKYNTAIAAIMEYVNYLSQKSKVKSQKLSSSSVKTLILLLAPFAPHLAEELWFLLNKREKSRVDSVHWQKWPKYDPKLVKEAIVEIVVQINGKVREKLKVKSQNSKAKNQIKALAKKSLKIRKYLKGKQVKKIIFVPGKLINFVLN